MKNKLLRLSLLSMLVLLCGGQMYAQDSGGGSSSTDELTLSTFGVSGTSYSEVTDVTVTSTAVYAGQMAGGNDAIQLRSSNSNSGIVTTASGGTVKSIKVEWNSNTADARTLDVYGKSTAYSKATELYGSDSQGTKIASFTKSDGTKEITIEGSYEYIGFRSNSGAMYIDKITIVWDANGTPDTRTATTVTLGDCATTGEAGATINLPTATVFATGAAAIDNATVTWSSSDEEVATISDAAAQINLLKAGTTTIKATFAGDETYKPSNASFTLTVTAAPITGAITSLQALQEAATSTNSTPATITFNGEQVVFVNGNNAYLADANGFGALIYTKNHGLEVGQTLTGTIDANIQLYQGAAEITEFSTEGLTIGSADVIPVEKTIGEVTIANQSTLVTLKDLTYSYDAETKTATLTEATGASIVFYDKFKTNATFTEEGTYLVTGIVVPFIKNGETILEICPRTADDIVKTSSGEEPIDQRQELTLSFPNESYEATIGEDFIEPALSGVPEDFDGTIVYSSSNGDVATVGMEGEITLKAPGTTVITADAMFSSHYKGSATYTLTVKEGTVEPEELANPYTYTFEQKTFDAKSQTKTLNAANWELNVTCNDEGGYFGYNEDKGQQFGSGNKPASALTLSTSDFPGTITKIVVNTSGASNIDATLNVTVGETAFEAETKTLTNVATDYEFTGSASGAITLSWANSSAKAIYVKSIYVEYTTEEQPAGFRNIVADLTQLQALATESDVYIKVAEDGTISQADNAEEAAATLKGKWHGTAYGWSNFTATVPVEGCVMITYATHDYGNDIIVTNDEGVEVAKLNTNGPKWSSDPSNVVVAYYRTNEPTTLHFSNANYNPYFAVEAIDPADLPAEVTEFTVTFETAGSDCEGTAPAAMTVLAGGAISIPVNYSLYKEGYTLTGWADTSVHAIASQLTVESDVTLTPVFTKNEVSLSDRTQAVTAIYTLSGYNDYPKYNYQGNTGIIVAQATVNGKTIDVKADVDATSGKFAYNGSGWHQVNTGTKVTVPSCKGATIAVTTYNDATSVTFNGTAGTAEENTATFTATTDDATVEIAQVSNNYWSSLTITLPKVEGDEPIVEPGQNDLCWDYTEENIPTKGPDRGLYYGAYVNDAAGTNNGFHGVKLNSEGYAFFAKNPVAGTLTLTFGNRKSADAYAVNVYACTIENGTATKGDLIGEVAVAASSGTNSIDIAADVTGIYIERKTTKEGVLQKIVFKENVARTFVDFEIPYSQLSKEFDSTTLPEGVTFSGTPRNDDHGYQNVTLVVPVDGTVKFTIGGCQYANPGTFTVTNSNNETVATLNQKTEKCYHQDGTAVTYIYIGEATTLTFNNIQYLPYFKAEATEVSEVAITYQDQNGNKLGTKTVYEGDALGEVPYTEADLTIEEGNKFRGWTYPNGIKVKATDIVTGNVIVKASVTAIEAAPTVGSVQTYDLTKATFYPEDHELFSVTNGSYYNNHGFNFAAGGSFSVDVAGKAQVVLSLCEYGSGTTIAITDGAGNAVNSEVPAKAEQGNDGATTTVQYDGEATTLTFTFAAQTYLHSVTVYNVSGFLAKDKSGYYIVPAGDAASLVMAINSANAEEDAKIFLPDGTYDLGESVKTIVSGKNVSIIGQSAENTIIVNRPPQAAEGLDKADLLKNTGEGLYMQDLSLKNDFAYSGNDGRAASLHDTGTKTICKNVFLLSHQDTYYSHKTGGLYYFEGGELHGTVDYLCGNGKAYFNEVKLVNEKRSSATITANSELYVFNNCTVENNADKYNFGRAWSDNPTCVYLNTTLLDPSHLVSDRWNLTGINCDYTLAGEYGTKNAAGEDITPEANNVTFTKQNTQMNTILSADQAATYTIGYVLGDWAATAQQEAKQLDAPAVTYADGQVTWTPANDGAIAYLIEKNGEFVGITTESSFEIEAGATDVLTIRAANSRGGFGEPAIVQQEGFVTVKLNGSGLATLASDKALDFANVDGLTAYIVKSKNETEAYLTSVDAAPAATGLVLKGTADAVYSIPVATTAPAAIEGNLLVAAVTAATVDANAVYVLSGDKFMVFEGTEIPAGKAYLPKNSSARSLQLVFDEATGISSTQINHAQMTNEVYNLAGQKLSVPTKKGVYVINGKKVIIK